MRILKIKIASKTLLDLGLPDFFSIVKHIEIVQIYQYDRTNFFSLHKILFKPNLQHTYEQYFSELFQAQSFQILEQHGEEVLCIMKQRNSTGFWPALLSGAWALIPPIFIDPDIIIFSIISKDEHQLSTILKQLKMFQSIELLATSRPENMIENLSPAPPGLTKRQREIMVYAQRHGYFDVPKKISVQELMGHFKINHSTISSHIQKAEKILMKYFFG